MALITLVATMPTARRTMENKIEPRIPISRAPSVAHLQSQGSALLAMAAAKSSKARYTTAIPRTTHRKAGVTVMTAVICKNAATTPMMTLARIAAIAQLHLKLQLHKDMWFTSHHNICVWGGKGAAYVE